MMATHGETKSLSLKHLVQRPRTAPPAGQKPPLLVLLHGVGSNEYDLFELASFFDPRLVVVSARGPLTHAQSGGAAWYPVTFTANGPIADEKVAAETREKIAAFLTEAADAYSADPKRIWIGGFSQGSIMSLFTLLTRPQAVAGAVLMSGRLLPTVWEQRAPDSALAGKAAIALHGVYDNVLPIQMGHEIREKLSGLPLDFTYKEYPMAHTISQESLADATKWLTAHLDAAAPTAAG